MVKLIQYWHSRDIPEEVSARIATVREKNPHHEHVLFDEDSATTLIESHFTSRELAAFAACAVPAMKCDYFRYCALYVLGGAYIDADFYCLKSLDPFFTDESRPHFVLRQENVQNGFIVVQTPQHPLMRFAIDIATINIETRSLGNNVWATTGPGIITTLREFHRLNGKKAFLASLPVRPELDREPLRRLAHTVQDWGGDQVGDLISTADYASIEEREQYLTHLPAPEYKSGGDHWPRWQGSIYK